jgi:hypothetical protein
MLGKSFVVFCFCDIQRNDFIRASYLKRNYSWWMVVEMVQHVLEWWGRWSSYGDSNWGRKRCLSIRIIHGQPTNIRRLQSSKGIVKTNLAFLKIFCLWNFVWVVLQHDGNGNVQEGTKGKLALFKGTQAFMMPRGKQSLEQTSHFC